MQEPCSGYYHGRVDQHGYEAPIQEYTIPRRKEGSMTARISLFVALALWLGSAAANAAQQSAPTVPKHPTVTIDTQQTADPVSKYVFGSFIEHIGPLGRLPKAFLADDSQQDLSVDR